VSISVPQGSETLLQTLAALCGASAALLLFSLVVWTARDIAARTRDNLVRVGAVLLVLLVPGVGLVAYALLRPRETFGERYERELIEEILAREVTSALPSGPRGPKAQGAPASKAEG
jgi:hypothetical protein